MNISDELKSTLVAIHREKGKQWIHELSHLMERIEKKYAITFTTTPSFKLSYNYVVPAVTSEGKKVVVKMSVPNIELEREAEWLKDNQSEQVVKMLDYDQKEGYLLLEQLYPGVSLSHINDDTKAVDIAATLMKSIRKEPRAGHSYSSIGDWVKGLERIRENFHGKTVSINCELVDLAEERFHYLLSTMEQSVLLHGDLHQDNILLSHTGWKMIDPKGVIGEREVEVIPFLRNNLWKHERPKSVLENRVNHFCHLLGLHRERILLWGFSLSILSAWWLIEDGQSQESVEQTLLLAQLFNDLLNS
ncbi:phosphotransferase [Bacillus sp. BGMRC 2118]|nr:phosphotransferase [Bacillus sp. BGMRC 2118]